MGGDTRIYLPGGGGPGEEASAPPVEKREKGDLGPGNVLSQKERRANGHW